MKRVFIAVRDFFKTADSVLLALCLISCAYGLVLIYSATLTYETNQYMIIQAVSVVLGIGLFVVLSIIDIDLIAEHWLIILIFDVLFIATLFKFGVEGGTGNKSWLRFGRVGIQPAEVVKVTFVVLYAKQLAWLRDTKNGVGSIGSVLLLAAHFAVMFGLILLTSRDLGSALVYFVIFLAMTFAAGVGLHWFLIGGALIVAASPFIWNHLLNGNQRSRILAPYFPDAVDPTGLGVTWHASQSKLALASGQLTGQGLTHGTQSQSSMLPFKHTDFIFAVTGEELGMIGCVAVIVLLVLIIIRVIYVGIRSNSYMHMLICVGYAAMLTFQTFENIGMCLGLTPVIGLTLPLFSYGGSSIVTTFAAMGIVSGIRMRPSDELRRHYS